MKIKCTFLVLVFSVATFASAADHTIRIVNNCHFKIWPGIAHNPGKSGLPANGGFALEPHRERTVHVPHGWAGRIWGRTNCNAHGHCGTGDCGGKVECHGAFGAVPATLAEIAFDQDKGMDFYDISLVDGFNLPVSMHPIAGTFHKRTKAHNDCTATICHTDINAHCPYELAVHGAHGHTIGCMSACAKFHTPEYCCTGAHDKPHTCLPKFWKVNYPGKFKHWCPEAYSYAYDDRKSTWACIGNGHHPSGYVVKFCP